MKRWLNPIWVRLKRVMWSEKYLFSMLITMIVMQAQILSKMWLRSRYVSELYLRGAYENSFLLDLASVELLFAYSYVIVFVAIIVCGNLYCEDRNAGTYAMMRERESYATYHIRNIACIVLSTIVFCLVPLLVNLLTSMACFPTRNIMDDMYATPAYAKHIVAGQWLSFFKAFHPVAYMYMQMVMVSATCVVFTLLNYGLSVFSGMNGYVCSVASFVFYVLFTTLPLHLGNGMQKYSLQAYLNAYDYGSYGVFFFLVGIVFVMSLLLAFARRKDI